MLLNYYLNKIGYKKIPKFLQKYLKSPSLLRLKKVGYFCGMDFASKDVYNFREYISRYDHSLTVALLTYKLTKDKKATIAGLFHDIATPCFSHVIDYMNEDYETQESTEEFTEKILKEDVYLNECLQKDNIDIYEIIDFKKYSIVDNERPKVCADRIDGLILTGMVCTKNIEREDIIEIVDNMAIFKNENNEDEIGFKTVKVAQKVLEINKSINTFFHSKEDNYMMQLLANITKLAVDKELISYEDLYYYDEEKIFKIFKLSKNKKLKALIEKFENIKMDEIPEITLANVKIRSLNPIVNGKRLN